MRHIISFINVMEYGNILNEPYFDFNTFVSFYVVVENVIYYC